MKVLFLALGLLLLPPACAPVGTIARPQPAVAVPPVLAPLVVTPPSPSASTYKAAWPNEAWTAELAKAIEEHGPALKTVPGPCSKRTQFFVMLFSSLAKYESGFKPSSTYTEAFPDAKGNRVVSRGLFQLSIESVNGARYKCGIKKAEELHDPKTNIICAVKVANALVKENNVVASGSAGAWKGMARYWSPFRTATKREAIMKAAHGSCQ